MPNPLNDIVNNVKGLMKLARIVAQTNDDTLPFPVQRVEYLGKTADSIVWHPYGFSANLPPDVLTIALALNGNAESRYSLASSPKERREQPLPNPLKVGETLMFNPTTKSFMFFREDGAVIQETQGEYIHRVKGNMTIIVDGNLKTTVAGNNLTDVEGNETLEVAGNYLADVEGTYDLDVEDDITITAPKTLIVGDYDQEGDAEVGIAGTTHIGNRGATLGAARDTDDVDGTNPQHFIEEGSSVCLISKSGGTA